MCYALAVDDGKTNAFAVDLRRDMSEVDRRDRHWGIRNSAEAIDTSLREALEDEIRHLVWRFAGGHQAIHNDAAAWQAEFAMRQQARRGAADAFAEEVEAWLVQRATGDANAKGQDRS